MNHTENSKLSNAQLRQHLDDGMPASQIAKMYSMSVQNVLYRKRRIRGNQIQVVAHVPQETRKYVGSQLDLMTMLATSTKRLELLQDACDEWLRDANRPEKYDIGARSNEVQVTYLTPPDDKGKRAKIKKPLSDLLAIALGQGMERESVETKFADPRETILKTVQEVRMTTQMMADIAERLIELQRMEKLRNALLELYKRYDPEGAAQLARDINTVSGLYVLDGDKKG